MNFSRRVKSSAMFEVWRTFREYQQRREFNFLLDRIGTMTNEGNSYSEAIVEERLHAKCGFRRKLRTDIAQMHVVGFGTHGWEDRGLWPSLARICDFKLFDCGEHQFKISTKQEREHMRAGLENAFLTFIDRHDQEHKVDVIFFYKSGLHISSQLLSNLHARGIWTVIMGLDDKHQMTRPVDEQGLPHQLRVAALCDLYWTTWRSGTQLILNAGGTPYYAPEAADPNFHQPQSHCRDLETVFIGQAYGSRHRLVQYLRKRGISVTTRGYGWPEGPATFEETISLFNRAQIVIGIGEVGYMTGVRHLKGRDFEAPMCGSAYLTQFNPELTDFFEIGREIICYSSFEECAELILWLRNQPAILQSLRERALARSLEQHTWTNRFQKLFDLFPKKQS